MTWHYRVFKVIPKHIKGKKKILQPESYFCIKEVYSGKKGLYSKNSIVPHGETKADLIKGLEIMLSDAKKYETKVERLTEEKK